jgi:DNA polymerase
MTPDNAKAVRDLLTFYAESGVDVALDEAPANRFADRTVPAAPPDSEEAPPKRPRELRAAAPAAVAAPAAPPPLPEEAIVAARAAAKSAASLEELRAIMAGRSGRCEPAGRRERHLRQPGRSQTR